MKYVVTSKLIEILVMFSFQLVKNRMQNCYHYSPMDVLKRSHRFSYAAAFGTLARLCADIVFNSKYAFTYTGPTYLKGLYL